MQPSGLRAVSGSGGGCVEPQVAVGVVLDDRQAQPRRPRRDTAARRASLMVRPVGFWKLGSR